MINKNTKAIKLIYILVLFALTGHCLYTVKALLSPPPIPVLLFHSIGKPYYRSDIWGITTAKFTDILTKLEERQVRPLDLMEVKTFLEKGVYPENPPYVLLTFDDACRSHLDLAAPELVSRQLNGVFFVTFPWTQKFTEEGRNSAFIGTPQELEQLSSAGDIQSHTRSYRTLIRKEEESQKDFDQRITMDLFDFKTELEHVTGKSVYALAYPSGEFNDRIIQLTEKAGYSLAFTTEYGTINKNSSAFTLPRFMITSNDSVEDVMTFIEGDQCQLKTILITEILALFFILLKLRKKRNS